MKNKRLFLIDEVISDEFYEDFVKSVETNKQIFRKVLKDLEKF